MDTWNSVRLTGQTMASSKSGFRLMMTLGNVNKWEPGEKLQHSIQSGRFYWNCFFDRFDRVEPRQGERSSKLKVQILSCNPDPMHAQIQVKAGKEILRKWTACTACPFGWMYEFCIPLKKIACGQQEFSCNSCMFEISMWYIRVATEADKSTTGYNASSIGLEVISRQSIEKRSNTEDASGVASPSPVPRNSVHPDTVIKYWKKQFPSNRFWNCCREKGSLKFLKCLDDFDQFTTFGQICRDFDGGLPVCCLFKESKPESEDFEPTTDARPFLIHIHEAGYGDLSYCEFMLVQETDFLQDIWEKIVHEKAGLDEDVEWRVYQEVFERYTIDITERRGTLAEHDDLYPGSVIIVRQSS